MATFDKPKSGQSIPTDLLACLRDAKILSDRQFGEVKQKVLRGDYPNDSVYLASRLVEDQILTEYQAKRLLKNRGNGLVVGRYVIVDRLGSGSMGRVYKAHHRLMDRYVAIKLIAPEIVSNEKVVMRFLREMRLVGRLNHPNVIGAYDADQIDRMFYIVLEYAQGISLNHRLKKGTIPLHEMVEYGAQAALGLAHAHAQGIVHRDVKPSNLLLTAENQIKVLDLGLGVLMEADSATSFATADGIAVGTVDYMSPEQACGKEVDGRSDLYSLGCTMYHLMTGRLPFPGDSPIERMGKRINGKPVPINEVRPDTPSRLVRVLDKLITQKPADRFQSATEAADALRSLLKPKYRGKSPGEAETTKSEASPGETDANGQRPPPPSDFPSWIGPLAVLSQARPQLALAAILGGLSSLFLLGVLVGWAFF